MDDQPTTQKGQQSDLKGEYYVYQLVCLFPDPEHRFHSWHNHVFYIGKGKGDRLYAHQRELRRLLTRRKPFFRGAKGLSHKQKFMLWVTDSGGEIGEEKVAVNLTEDRAFDIENILIGIFGLEYLTNEAPPHRLSKNRPKSTRRRAS